MATDGLHPRWEDVFRRWYYQTGDSIEAARRADDWEHNQEGTYMNWEEIYFDERQRKEIAFARVYATQFCHGTDGHNAKLIISKMADMLDQFYVPKVAKASE